MTEIVKGGNLPVPGQTDGIESPASAGPVPLDIPRGGIGKTSDPGADLAEGQSSGTGEGQSSGTASESSSAAGARAGTVQGQEDPPGPPRRTDLRAEGGRWAELFTPSPVSRPEPSPGSSAEPSPRAAAVAGILGGEFDDIVYTGRGGAKFRMEETPPPGYVLVEFAWTGRSFSLDSIDWNGRQAVSFGYSVVRRSSERRTMWCDNLYPLRFSVQCDPHDEWVIVIRSISGVRELGGAATGWGSEVLLHTGPAGDLVSRLHASEAKSLGVQGHGPHRPGAPDRFRTMLASGYGQSVKERRKLPEGPLLVEVVSPEGEWSLEVREHQEPKPRAGFWARLRRR
ncbi:hypothetical protein [Streptomyces gardneri]|uniref:hypothetical protein n=1 Tax=Streptomyces gardneri TaxID=66892 RepID=UPI0036990ABD